LVPPALAEERCGLAMGLYGRKTGNEPVNILTTFGEAILDFDPG
jgi:hypothetical protein